MASPAAVAIIANPFSGKDIRRLVAYASLSDNLSKVRMLQRVLLGIRESGVGRVLYMPDPAHLVPSAWDGLTAPERADLQLEPLLDVVYGASDDTLRAARAAAGRGAGAIVTLGGDGTNRLVAAGAPAVPLLPLATGTNNVFPLQVEATVAGLAAGLVAGGRYTGLCRRAKLLRVQVGEHEDVALVDVALLQGTFLGTGAVWEPATIRELVVTQAGPHLTGLAAIAGRVAPVGRDEAAGAYVSLGAGPCLRALIAPGRFADVAVTAARRISVGEQVVLGPGPGVLAYDGERLLLVPPGARPRVELVQSGPPVIDPALVLGGNGS